MTKGKHLEEYRPIIHKYDYVRSRKLLDSSRNQVCTFGFQGCNYDAETTVACHSNSDICGKGMGIKASDIYSADGCHFCHSVYDGREPTLLSDSEKEWYFWRAFVKTTNRRISEGLITVAGAK